MNICWNFSARGCPDESLALRHPLALVTSLFSVMPLTVTLETQDSQSQVGAFYQLWCLGELSLTTWCGCRRCAHQSHQHKETFKDHIPMGQRKSVVVLFT